jgi:hypothetical protein
MTVVAMTVGVDWATGEGRTVWTCDCAFSTTDPFEMAQHIADHYEGVNGKTGTGLDDDQRASTDSEHGRQSGTRTGAGVSLDDRDSSSGTA